VGLCAVAAALGVDRTVTVVAGGDGGLVRSAHMTLHEH
jgi:hypothetical protein